jgi:hypothetical protein
MHQGHPIAMAEAKMPTFGPVRGGKLEGLQWRGNQGLWASRHCLEGNAQCLVARSVVSYAKNEKGE